MPRRFLIYLALIGLCFLAYANTLNNSFISDDIPAILENPQISNPLKFLFDPHGLMNSLSFRIFGRAPFMYHVFSILLHAINTVLVFLVLRLFFKVGPSFLGSLLFAAHPIHTEAVTWISGRPYELLALFVLGSYLLYQNATSQKKLKFTPYLLCLIILAYFMVRNYTFFVLFPFLLILSDITFGKWRRSWKFWLGFFAVLAFGLILARGAIQERIIYMTEEVRAPMHRNPIDYFVYSFYSHLWLLIWPVRLTLFHDPAIITQNLHDNSIFYLIPVILLLVFTFKKARVVFFSLGLFILFLAPTYSPLPIASLVAERYLYLSSFSLCVVAAFLYERCAVKYKKLKIYFLACLISLIVFYSGRTILRNRDWRGPEIFWEKTLEISGGSPRVHNNMGLVYFHQKLFTKAKQHYNKAIELDSSYAEAYNNLANLNSILGNSEEAFRLYESAIKNNPKLLEAYNNLSQLYISTGRFNEALDTAKKLIAVNPRYPEGYNFQGVALFNLKENEAAIVSLKKAIELNPRYVRSYNNLAAVYNASGRRTEAISYLNKALSIDPDFSLTHFNFALVYFNEGEFNLSLKHCDQAIRLGFGVPREFLEAVNKYRQK